MSIGLNSIKVFFWETSHSDLNYLCILCNLCKFIQCSVVGIFVVGAAAYSAVMNLGEFYYEEDKVTREMTGMIAEESAAYSAVLWESRGVCACLGNQAFPSFITKTGFLRIFCTCLHFVKI